MQPMIATVLRVVFAFFLLLLLTRLMGRKMISQLTYFDFIVAITLGSVTANLAIGTQATPTKSAIVLVTLAFLTIIFGFIYIKSFSFRKLVNSEPVIIIQNGKIINQNMNKIRLTVDDLLMKLRESNIFDLTDVEFAIFETDGKLSVLPKSQKQPVTPSDLRISTTYKGLTKDLVIDGNIMQENLHNIDLDESWLTKQIQKQNIKDIHDVFYAGLDTEGNLYVSVKENTVEQHGQHGIE